MIQTQHPSGTSYATSYGGYSNVNANAVAAPNESDDEATSQTWVWGCRHRGTQTGGSFHRNSSSNTTSVPSSGCKTYIPRHYRFNWRYLSWGVKSFYSGGSGNSNSMDNFSAGTNDINRICYVDGLSAHGANATNGGWFRKKSYLYNSR